MSRKIIAVDFDGTVVDHRFPDTGPDVPDAVNTLHRLINDHNFDIILWTMRSGGCLINATEWYRKHNIRLFGVNENPEQGSWTTSPKAYAHYYVDDAAIGVPLLRLAGFKRLCVDWLSVYRLIISNNGF